MYVFCLYRLFWGVIYTIFPRNVSVISHLLFVFTTVITGTVITAVIRGGSMHATVSIINVYKEGNLAIQQAGKTMSTKIVILCKKCPVIRRGECTA